MSPKSRSRPLPRGEWKSLGGSDRDQWNDRLLATIFGVSEGRYLTSGINQEIRKRTPLFASKPAGNWVIGEDRAANLPTLSPTFALRIYVMRCPRRAEK